MRCQNCGQIIVQRPGSQAWEHVVSGAQACDFRPMATPAPRDTPTVTPVDGR